MWEKMYNDKKKKPTLTILPISFLDLTSLSQREFILLLVEFGPLFQAHYQRYDLQGNLRKIPKLKEDQRSSLPGD